MEPMVITKTKNPPHMGCDIFVIQCFWIFTNKYFPNKCPWMCLVGGYLFCLTSLTELVYFESHNLVPMILGHLINTFQSHWEYWEGHIILNVIINLCAHNVGMKHVNTLDAIGSFLKVKRNALTRSQITW